MLVRINGSRHAFIQKEYICCNFQTFSASHLLPRITASAYARRSAGSLLLLLPPPCHSPSSWDISGDAEGENQRSQERQQTGRLLREQTQTHLLPPPQRGAENSPETGRPHRRGTGQHPETEQARGYLRSGEERAARKPTAYRPQQKWKKKAKNLERWRYSKHYNPNSLIYSREKQSPQGKRAPE